MCCYTIICVQCEEDQGVHTNLWSTCMVNVSSERVLLTLTWCVHWVQEGVKPLQNVRVDISFYIHLHIHLYTHSLVLILTSCTVISVHTVVVKYTVLEFGILWLQQRNLYISHVKRLSLLSFSLTAASGISSQWATWGPWWWILLLFCLITLGSGLGLGSFQSS